MKQTIETLKLIVEKMALSDARVSADEENRKISIFLNDENVHMETINLPSLVQDFNIVAQLIAKKQNEGTPVIDINNYRLERERIITELAKAAARKVIATKAEIILPAMNAYERRLVHVALAAHPEVKTESTGEGKSRSVTIKLL